MRVYFVGGTKEESVLVHNACVVPGCTGHGAGWVSGRSWGTWFWGQDHQEQTPTHVHKPGRPDPPAIPDMITNMPPAVGGSIGLDGRDVEAELNEMLDGALDIAQGAMDVAGFVPGVGDFLDLCNAGISWIRGDKASAAIRAIAAVPFAGIFAQVEKGKIPYQLVDSLPGNLLGITTPNGEIFIRKGLPEDLFEQTLKHESVHRFLSSKGTSYLSMQRADWGIWLYGKSSLLRFLEEGLAYGYGGGGFFDPRSPFQEIYKITPWGVMGESITVTAIYGTTLYSSYSISNYYFNR